MKKILVLISVLQSFFVLAQEAPKPIQFNAKNTANIFYYNLEEVVEKIKVKKEETKNATRKALRGYNDNVKDISFLNFQKLQDLEFLVNSKGEEARKDVDLAIKIRKQMEETILPVRDSIKKNEEELNTTLQGFLSKKQFKKWKKYQKRKKQSLLPKPPQQNNTQSTRPPLGQRNRRY